jgi:hypothetical protein
VDREDAKVERWEGMRRQEEREGYMRREGKCRG